MFLAFGQIQTQYYFKTEYNIIFIDPDLHRKYLKPAVSFLPSCGCESLCSCSWRQPFHNSIHIEIYKSPLNKVVVFIIYAPTKEHTVSFSGWLQNHGLSPFYLARSTVIRGTIWKTDGYMTHKAGEKKLSMAMFFILDGKTWPLANCW